MHVLIADDHFIVREGLKQIIKKIDKLSVIDESNEGNETLSKIEVNKYDLVILDVSMPGLSGLDILKTLKDREDKVNILVLSMHPQEQYAIRAFNLGASGYLCKDSINEELEAAINKIAVGGKYISQAFAENIIFTKNGGPNKLLHENLSEREFQIICMIARGKTIKEIAGDLFISPKTVSSYRTRIMDKMNMKKNSELTLYAIKNNLIE